MTVAVNNNAPFGLRAVRNRDSGGYCGQGNQYLIPASDANAMAIGDPVVLAGSSNDSAVAGSTELLTLDSRSDGFYPTIQLATAGAGNPILGTIMGFLPRLQTGVQHDYHRKANEEMYALVHDSKDFLYEIQALTGTQFTADMVGQNVDLVAGAPETVYGRSQWAADLATVGTGATQQLRIEGLQRRGADNRLTADGGTGVGDSVKLLVSINNHQRGNVTAGV